MYFRTDCEVDLDVNTPSIEQMLKIPRIRSLLVLRKQSRQLDETT